MGRYQNGSHENDRFRMVLGHFVDTLFAVDGYSKIYPRNAATSTPLWIKMLPWSRLAFGKQHYAYDPPAWSRVFPMGMYTASTLFLGQAAGIEYLAIISQYWGWFALLIWFLTFMGMLRAVIHTIRLPTSKQYD